MDSKSARSAISDRLKRALDFFGDDERAQVSADPEEVRAILSEDCPEDMQELRDGLMDRTPPRPTHVILSIDQARRLSTPVAKKGEDAKQPGK